MENITLNLTIQTCLVISLYRYRLCFKSISFPILHSNSILSSQWFSDSKKKKKKSRAYWALFSPYIFYSPIKLLIYPIVSKRNSIASHGWNFYFKQNHHLFGESILSRHVLERQPCVTATSSCRGCALGPRVNHETVCFYFLLIRRGAGGSSRSAGGGHVSVPHEDPDPHRPPANYRECR